MKTFEQNRRSFLFTVGTLGMTGLLQQGIIEAQSTARQGYVLGATEGEHLVHFRDHDQAVGFLERNEIANLVKPSCDLPSL
jgi:hypothetical protein